MGGITCVADAVYKSVDLDFKNRKYYVHRMPTTDISQWAMKPASYEFEDSDEPATGDSDQHKELQALLKQAIKESGKACWLTTKHHIVKPGTEQSKEEEESGLQITERFVGKDDW